MPIMIRKPRASITTVGLSLMNLASGSAATSITITALITAMIMIGRCSVMPTAVMMLSIENTMSSIRIWKIAAAKPMVTVLPSLDSSLAPGVDAVMDLLGRLPHQEQATGDQDHVLPREGVAEHFDHRLGQLDDPGDGAQQRQAHDQRHADTDASRLRADCSGSLLVRIEMKIRLSMPSTISMATRVARATQAVGLAASSSKYSIGQSCFGSGGSDVLGVFLVVFGLGLLAIAANGLAQRLLGGLVGLVDGLLGRFGGLVEHLLGGLLGLVAAAMANSARASTRGVPMDLSCNMGSSLVDIRAARGAPDGVAF
jgi:hypothetical protein